MIKLFKSFLFTPKEVAKDISTSAKIAFSKEKSTGEILTFSEAMEKHGRKPEEVAGLVNRFAGQAMLYTGFASILSATGVLAIDGVPTDRLTLPFLAAWGAIWLVTSKVAHKHTAPVLALFLGCLAAFAGVEWWNCPPREIPEGVNYIAITAKMLERPTDWYTAIQSFSLAFLSTTLAIRQAFWNAQTRNQQLFTVKMWLKQRQEWLPRFVDETKEDNKDNVIKLFK